MSDDIIGSIEGTATFEIVEILKEKSGKARVVGTYHGSTTTYETDLHRVHIGGMPLNYLDHSLALEPPGDENYLWVEATKDELRITEERPSDE